jgi:alkanesulfonate monooxygenase SsuD/methylene tetrahydromethanopterin reductase-like flavin-dependent oxidoreductase (luciferase family)
VTVHHIAFLTPGNYNEDNPRGGLEAALKLFETGEALGFDSAWVRSRHLERGISSATTFLAAASQRTRRIGLGSAVIQLGYENLFRLAEDLSTTDLLSGERLQVGVSAGPPLHGKLLGDRLFEGDQASQDFSHERALRLRENLSGRYLATDDRLVSSPAGDQRPRLQPHSPTLPERLWYGGGSRRASQWSGRNGFHFLIGNLVQGEDFGDFFEAQREHIETFHRAWSRSTPPRIALGRVIVPTDSADEASRRRYAAFAESRHARTLAPQGERRILFARDLIGSSEQILEWLKRDPILPELSELRLELPYDFSLEQYQQILTDFVSKVAPHVGWRPSVDPVPPYRPNVSEDMTQERGSAVAAVSE